MNLDGSYLMSSLLISCLGMGFFMYGKKAQRLFPLLAGILLSIYPFFITGILAMWLIAAAIMVALYFLRNM